MIRYETRGKSMKTFAAAAVFVLLMALPAIAQGMPGGKGHHGSGQKADAPKKKPDDKAYNAAISGIPDRNFDPWRDARQRRAARERHGVRTDLRRSAEPTR